MGSMNYNVAHEYTMQSFIASGAMDKEQETCSSNDGIYSHKEYMKCCFTKCK